jgi:hypothetical protein
MVRGLPPFVHYPLPSVMLPVPELHGSFGLNPNSFSTQPSDPIPPLFWGRRSRIDPFRPGFPWATMRLIRQMGWGYTPNPWRACFKG